MEKDYFEKRLKFLEEHLQKLDAEINQLIANRNLVQGAIQEINFYLQTDHENIGLAN